MTTCQVFLWHWSCLKVKKAELLSIVFHLQSELAKSISEHDVVTPAITRPCKGGTYELISGYRRKAACEVAGIDTLPVLVRNLDDDAAAVIMVNSNQQRDNIMPSEKAFAYNMKLEVMKRKTGRPAKTRDKLSHNIQENAQPLL